MHSLTASLPRSCLCREGVCVIALHSVRRCQLRDQTGRQTLPPVVIETRKTRVPTPRQLGFEAKEGKKRLSGECRGRAVETRTWRTFWKVRASPSSAGVPKLLRQGRSHCNELRGLIARTAIETAVRKANSEDDQGLLRKRFAVC